ncbi:MAG: hypothetical protein K0S41_1625 [Anaerocolumna sp.]|jgi:hypothetical protein|nr:hypothetical protein [Anaerocolumna sp.]
MYKRRNNLHVIIHDPNDTDTTATYITKILVDDLIDQIIRKKITVSDFIQKLQEK